MMILRLNEHPVSVERKFDPIPDHPRVMGGISTPRVGFTGSMGCMMDVCGGGAFFAVTRQYGAFWHKAVGQCVKVAIEHDCELICFMDYDSIFSTDDIRALVEIVKADEECAAVFPVQMHRTSCRPLVYHPDQDNGLPTAEALTGHFGCTIIRTEVFRRIPKPWFMNIPDENGEWEEGSIDPDIYFWKLLRHCGLKVLRANGVTIGHLEHVVLWPDKDKMAAQMFHDYAANGKPPVKWTGFKKKESSNGEACESEAVGEDGRLCCNAAD